MSRCSFLGAAVNNPSNSVNNKTTFGQSSYLHTELSVTVPTFTATYLLAQESKAAEGIKSSSTQTTQSKHFISAMSRYSDDASEDRDITEDHDSNLGKLSLLD